MNTLVAPQPFVKWVGGKRNLLRAIYARLPPVFNNYFEPFVGGGALFFALREKIKHAVLVDQNLELVLAYQTIKKEPKALMQKLREHADKHSKTYYYNVRKRDMRSPLEIAARFLYLNKTCFNGLYRVNQSGRFNAPMGKYKNPNILQEKNIWACHEALKRMDIYYGDFEQIGPLVERGDFIYFDPPYHPTNELSFTAYTKENFTEKDQVRLRDFVMEMHKRGAFVMLSNSKTKLIEDLYRHRCFRRHIVYAPRFVNCKPGERDKVQEYLITNY